LQALKRILAQPFQKRDVQELEHVADLIQDLKYFKKIAHDPQERHDFVTKCAQFFKYEYYPKGFEVVRRGNIYM